MSNSELVDYVKISPNKTVMTDKKIDKIIVHHMAGDLSVETCGNIFARESRGASSNYGIGTDGRIAMYVEEKDRSWCSSSPWADGSGISIEVANCGREPDWPISNAAWMSLILLCTDICKRNGIKDLVFTGGKEGNLLCHRFFAATACPGPYLYAKMTELAHEVNLRLGVCDDEDEDYYDEDVPEDDISDVPPSNDFVENIAYYAKKIAPMYGIRVISPVVAQAILESARGTSNKAKHNNFFGLKFRPGRVTVSSGRFLDGSSEQLPDGSYVPVTDYWLEFENMRDGVEGYFQFINVERYENLKGIEDPREYVETIRADGYATSLSYVDNIMRVIEQNNLTRFDPYKSDNKKPVEVLAREVLSGLWGNGAERKRRLEEAGYSYTEVQSRVNELVHFGR